MMFKLTLKVMAVLLIFAFAGCGGGESEQAGQGEAPAVEAGAESELSDEALIDIMATSSYLSMELQEEFEADPEAATEEFQSQMEEVAQEHGVTLQDLETNAAYEQQWNEIMSDPEMQQQFQERMQELQSQ